MDAMEKATVIAANTLFENPISNWISNDQADMPVLIIGNSLFASSFIDMCLQVGQVYEKSLIITSLSPDKEAFRKEFIITRPGLSDFVGINAGKAEAYATLIFEEASTDEMLRTESCSRMVSQGHRYIIVATEDFLFNKEVAALFHSRIHEKCFIGYLTDDSETLPDCSSIFAGDSVKINETLLRLAFNTNAVWAEQAGTSWRDAEDTFNSNDSYNKDSSIAFATSIPYKLASLGIAETDYLKAAEFLSTASVENDANLILANIEHRRWLMYALCHGWIGFTDMHGKMDYTFCQNSGNTKDQATHRHICIVHANKGLGLKTWCHDQWANPGSYDEELDDLDKVSIMLHRKWAEYTTDHFPNGSAVDQALALFDDHVKKDRQCEREFNHFRLCAHNVLDWSEGYAKTYGVYRKKLIAAINNSSYFDENTKCALRKSLSIFDQAFKPVIQRTLYVDYKATDIALMIRLPFILTFKYIDKLAMPLCLIGDQSGEVTLSNIASALVLHPKTVYYLSVIEKHHSADDVISKLHSLCNFYKTKRMHQLYFIPVFLGVKEWEKKKYQDACQKLHNAFPFFGYSMRYYSNNYAEAASVLISYIRENNINLYDGSNSLFASNRANSDFTERIIQECAYFEFDLTDCHFMSDTGCEFVHYVGDSDCRLQIRELFALANGFDNVQFQDYAREYSMLWQIYSGSATNIPFMQSTLAWNVLFGGKGRKITADNVTVEWKYNTRDLPKGITYDILNKVLMALESKRIIKNLRTNLNNEKGSALYQYGNSKYKDLFEKGGNFLEIYVYYSLCETGCFDDVITGYRVDWNNSGVENELDCVATKGLNAVIIECKATAIDEKFVYKLDSIAKHLGGHTTKVLISTSDPLEKSILRDRAEMLDIILIQGKKEIENAGQTLIKMMEGR